ncbi:lysozyme-like protein [Dentipellis sp. KUC8613]|nr:lysozyme-like protein [Dentipellis sp. KUC8613]
MKLSAALSVLVALAVAAVEAKGVHTDVLTTPNRHSRVSRRADTSLESRAMAAGASNKLINVQSSCPANVGATKNVKATSGPNGGIKWLNCGIDGAGWTPPYVKVTDLVTMDLSAAIADPNSPFKACSDFVWLFEKYGGKYGIPPIMLASFAMQESSCNPATVGGAGEQGLMQLTSDKCTQAPGGNCQDPEYNIRTGAHYFSQSLKANGGDVLKTIGEYNGWQPGMTYADATAAAHTDCCRCQKNLDYLHQFVNGWLRNIDAYTHRPRLGLYFNLDVCGN